MTPQDPLGSPVDPAAAEADAAALPPEEGEAKKGFFSTTTGRIVGIVLALLVVGGIVAAIAVFLMLFVFNSAVDEVTDDLSVTPTTTATASVEGTMAEALEPDKIPYPDIYTFRDIFDPLVRPPVEEETGTVDPAEGKYTSESVSEGTLLLEGIVVENGVPTAILVYNGTTYRLIEGDVIPGTPWEVLTINETSVTMLYGDTQVTLTVGQAVTR
jgi:hypothetical protein